MRSALLGELRLYLCNRVIAHLPSHRLRNAFYRRCMEFAIAPDSSIFMGAWFYCSRGLSLAGHSVINQNCRLDTRAGIKIGSRVSLCAEVTILTADHDPKDPQLATDRLRPVTIEDYVFVATRAMILPGVTLGYGSMVGAGAVVTRDVAPYSIVAGNPAREIGQRPKDLSYDPGYRRFLW